MLFDPLVVEPAWQLNGELAEAFLFGETHRFERSKPGPEALSADVVPDDVQAAAPGVVRRVRVHRGVAVLGGRGRLPARRRTEGAEAKEVGSVVLVEVNRPRPIVATSRALALNVIHDPSHG